MESWLPSIRKGNLRTASRTSPDGACNTKAQQIAQCPFKNLPKKKGLAMWRVANSRENEAMPLGQPEARLPSRFHRVDGCRALEALHLHRHAR